MEFTTRFELHSQATRLWGKSRHSAAAALRAYHPLRAVAPVKVDLDGRPRREVAPPNTTFRATPGAGGSVMGSARFIRHYSGHHGCFLFLRLLICLNLAGHLACSQVEVGRRRRGEGSRRPPRGTERRRPPAPPSARPVAGRRAGTTPVARPEESPRERPAAQPVLRGAGSETRGHAAGPPTRAATAAARAQCRVGRRGRPGEAKPTLSQTWTVDEPASAMCVQSVDAHMSCSSHSDAQFAAFFIDPRAK